MNSLSLLLLDLDVEVGDGQSLESVIRRANARQLSEIDFSKSATAADSTPLFFPGTPKPSFYRI